MMIEVALLGRTAAELLLAESDADESHEHHEVRFHPQLVARASSVRRGGASPE
jgi:LacI family transcriptional regulator